MESFVRVGLVHLYYYIRTIATMNSPDVCGIARIHQRGRVDSSPAQTIYTHHGRGDRGASSGTRRNRLARRPGVLVHLPAAAGDAIDVLTGVAAAHDGASG